MLGHYKYNEKPMKNILLVSTITGKSVLKASKSSIEFKHRQIQICQYNIKGSSPTFLSNKERQDYSIMLCVWPPANNF
jgi:hypothetical protein